MTSYNLNDPAGYLGNAYSYRPGTYPTYPTTYTGDQPLYYNPGTGALNALFANMYVNTAGTSASNPAPSSAYAGTGTTNPGTSTGTGTGTGTTAPATSTTNTGTGTLNSGNNNIINIIMNFFNNYNF